MEKKSWKHPSIFSALAVVLLFWRYRRLSFVKYRL